MKKRPLAYLLIGLWPWMAPGQEKAALPAATSHYHVIRAVDRDQDGVATYFIASPYLKGESRLRILFPRKPTHKLLFVLPVTPWPGFDDHWKRFGDGLEAVRQGDYHNRHGYIVVCPDFPDTMPWFVDHATDPGRRQESYVLKVVVPLVDEIVRLPKPQRDLLGFSKSGFGAVYLLLRHPGVFRAGSAWDPASVTNTYEPQATNSLSQAAGSAAQFARCDIRQALSQNASHFRAGPRIALSGYSSAAFQTRLETLHLLLAEAGVPHAYNDQIRVAHAWPSGWLGQAIESLTQLPAPNPGVASGLNKP